MLSSENKVHPNSDFYLYTPSNLTKELFFYAVCVGHFIYESGYHLIRNNYNSFLLLLVQEGTMAVTVNKKTWLVQPGEIMILDGYQPHEYGCLKDANCLWIHFDGPMAQKQFNQLYKTFGAVISPRNLSSVQHTLLKIINTFRTHSPVRDSSMSKYITNILNELFLSGTKKRDLGASSLNLEHVLSYINKNYSEPITLNELAKEANLSPYYFTRLFSKETGFTPHQFIIITRINIAKFLLKTSTQSIKEIAFSCGFNSESSFCSAFKKAESVTPGE